MQRSMRTILRQVPPSWIGATALCVLAALWIWPRTAHPELVLLFALGLGLLTFGMARRLCPATGGRFWVAAVLIGIGAYTPFLFVTPLGGIALRLPAIVFLVISGIIGTASLVRQPDRRIRTASVVTLTCVVVAGVWIFSGSSLAYRTDEIAWRNGDVSLSGTLYLPRGDGPHQLVIVVGGSGPGTRSDYSGWADTFARNGIAALVYDKRGSGASKGGSPRDSYLDLAADIAVAVDILASRREIDADQIGVWGHSEGGWVAPLAASIDERIRFVVIVSAGVPVGRNVEYQTSLLLADAGLTGDEIVAVQRVRSATNEYYRTGEGRASVEQRLRTAMAEPWWDAASRIFPLPSSIDDIPEYGSAEANDWLAFWDFSALPLLAELGIPVLSAHGGQDHLDPGYESAEAMRLVIESADIHGSHVLLYPDAGHAIEISPLGIRFLPPYYPEGYVETVVDWIAMQE